MAGKSNYLENAVLNHFLKAGTAVSQPTNVYVALFTDATVLNVETGASGTEVAGGAYARQTVAFSTATTGTTSNSADVLFPVATGNWGNVRYFGIYDAAAAGNLLYAGQFSADKNVATDDQLKIAAGQLTVSED